MGQFFPLNRQKFLADIREADNTDLLQRVALYREGMDADATALIEEELAKRGIKWQEIEEFHRQWASKVLYHPDGAARRCSFCDSPATREGWGWHCLFGRIPLFPKHYFCCDRHLIPCQRKQSNST